MLILLKKYCSSTKKEQCFLLENGQFRNQKPNKWVTKTSRSTFEYKFLSRVNLLIGKIPEKYYFNNPNSLGPPPTHLPSAFNLTIGFPVFIDPQWDNTLS